MTIRDLLLLSFVVAFVVHVWTFVYVLRQLPNNVALRLLLAIGFYVAHGALGIAVIIYFLPVLSHALAAPYGAVTALFGWFGLGLHVLFRLIPTVSDKPKPEWMSRFGTFDVACLAAIVGGIAVSTGLV
jgi:hypothetical protein